MRCRSVSAESADSTRLSAPAAPPATEVSLLSFMAMNVVAFAPRIKHVFDRRVPVAGGHEEWLGLRAGSPAPTETCRWCGLPFCACDTLRSNVRISNT
ncbi:Uncharacterised protein [Mycobacterium tuberculosis]|nr:Uncharacterised protein [Mycobacterium tuberculosis]